MRIICELIVLTFRLRLWSWSVIRHCYLFELDGWEKRITQNIDSWKCLSSISFISIEASAKLHIRRLNARAAAIFVDFFLLSLQKIFMSTKVLPEYLFVVDCLFYGAKWKEVVASHVCFWLNSEIPQVWPGQYFLMILTISSQFYKASALWPIETTQNACDQER